MAILSEHVEAYLHSIRPERDPVMREMEALAEREHVPIVHFVAPKVFVAASARVTNLNPARLRPQLLWSPDTIAVRH